MKTRRRLGNVGGRPLATSPSQPADLPTPGNYERTRFTIRRRSTEYFLATWASLTVTSALLGGHDTEWASPWGTAIVIGGGCLWLGWWLLRGGTITIDQRRRLIEWRRPGIRTAPSRIWPFDDVTVATVRARTKTDVVALDIGRRHLEFETRPNSGHKIAAAIRSATTAD